MCITFSEMVRKALRLPDAYNGLGFKNLIYMVVEILDLHARWVADKEQRAPLHLVFIEEPERTCTRNFSRFSSEMYLSL